MCPTQESVAFLILSDCIVKNELRFISPDIAGLDQLASTWKQDSIYLAQ